MLSKIDNSKFNTLIDVTNLINSNYADRNTLLTHIIDSAAKLCDGEASSLLLMDKETEELHFEVALGSAGHAVKSFTVKMGEGIAGWVALHNRSIIVNDAENDTRHLKDIAKKINYASKTILAVPMRVKDECLGVIEIINKKNGKYFDQEDLEWVEIFANQAGIAIANARSMEKVRGEIEMLRGRLNAEQEQTYHSMIAKSPVILEKLAIVEQVAKTDSSVLILGESGVGKELFAEQIHLLSNRRKKAFIRVNCAAIPEGLLESELFGHVKGAFTNAVSSRQGRFELANGGTLFLDEIGDLSLPLQAKILRVLQEKTFEKVGSDVSITVDVRILAATNQDIEKQVEKGKFRNDLYYRLNVLPLYIPPLRQRPEDIPALADFFLKKYMSETKKQFDGFSEEAMQTMLSYSWPGNIRELENCIERACVIGKDKHIRSLDLFLKSPVSQALADSGERNLKNAVNVFKTRFIQMVLEENKGNQTETAKALDIQRTYLSRLIKELEINTKE